MGKVNNLEPKLYLEEQVLQIPIGGPIGARTPPPVAALNLSKDYYITLDLKVFKVRNEFSGIRRLNIIE